MFEEITQKMSVKNLQANKQYNQIDMKCKIEKRY